MTHAWHSLRDLLRLQLDRLPVHEDALPLVRLGLAPLPDARRERRHRRLVRALDQQPRRLRARHPDAARDALLDRVRVADLERDELLARVLGPPGLRRGLDARAEADAHEADDGRVALGHAEDVVIEDAACGACRAC